MLHMLQGGNGFPFCLWFLIMGLLNETVFGKTELIATFPLYIKISIDLSFHFENTIHLVSVAPLLTYVHISHPCVFSLVPFTPFC